MCQANTSASGDAVSEPLVPLQSSEGAEAAETQWLPPTPDMMKFLAKFDGDVEWGSISPKSDAEHVADFADTLRMTREHFNLGDAPLQLHGVYRKGTEIVICHTGISPNSAMTAQLIAGLLHSATKITDEISSLQAENARLKASARRSIEEPGTGDTAAQLIRQQPDTKILTNAQLIKQIRAYLEGDDEAENIVVADLLSDCAEALAR